MISLNRPFVPPTLADKFDQDFLSGIQDCNDHKRNCNRFLENRFGFERLILTNSCTSALELCALVIDAGANDEIIVPGYTYVSSANSFVLRGATVRFADTYDFCPNLNVQEVESLISPRTKAIVVVHYAGIATELERLAGICRRKGIVLIEDAAHSIDATYENKHLGSFGDFATFSFHRTKNVSSGRGGMLVVNNEHYWDKALLCSECGTDRLINKGSLDSPYSWVELGSNGGMSNLTAFLLHQSLEHLDEITAKRQKMWEYYYKELQRLSIPTLRLPYKAEASNGNGHVFYLMTEHLEERNNMIRHLQNLKIMATFHYLPLNESSFAKKLGIDRSLKNTRAIYETLIRLPLHFYLRKQEQDRVMAAIETFYKSKVI